MVSLLSGRGAPWSITYDARQHPSLLPSIDSVAATSGYGTER
jgi:hypothetical protein